MIPFRTLYVDGLESSPRVGDRLTYDEQDGTLSIQRDDSAVLFQPAGQSSPAARIFIGRGWPRDLTRASAELYSRLGGLSGEVIAVDGPFPLQVFEIAG